MPELTVGLIIQFIILFACVCKHMLMQQCKWNVEVVEFIITLGWIGA